eukprot:CAMPEP_0202969868 /NCGR_PEP_ID=MMETSP1396-20130829/15774_1 /ASSEMBLY_ACC=CAM_ASM_000872 /TAXON_ID= /ORGANISM="Pseudokeronopsis sp., Strain Brazil" /LENGTH=44 /DNA_ID= /DNA_START= /DNA_END= /DNA_ORIENTATION=
MNVKALFEMIAGKETDGLMSVGDIEVFLQKWKYITPHNTGHYKE